MLDTAASCMTVWYSIDIIEHLLSLFRPSTTTFLPFGLFTSSKRSLPLLIAFRLFGFVGVFVIASPTNLLLDRDFPRTGVRDCFLSNSCLIAFHYVVPFFSITVHPCTIDLVVFHAPVSAHPTDKTFCPTAISASLLRLLSSSSNCYSLCFPASGHYLAVDNYIAELEKS